ncbi:hypothetical protein [Paenarthrobacter sp. PH39-S1]|uniref:hypothetical protein n=1 Tax=Paenarthrobacter sp. PH39-S1 TaxID=3046204 RepID=UPI0024BA0B63|nr:hypothetical protein [Paenarthrobacter sp. PH39-S1]MDJ0354834.1 hypothetical protein [Paenarthrobacter sp. PH39-S1]
MGSRHMGNNWFPMAGMAALFLGGAAMALMANSDKGAVPSYYLIAAFLYAGATALWFLRNPPVLRAELKPYLYTAGGMVLGVLLGGTTGILQGCLAWLALGGGVLAYGVLERTRVIVTAGAGACVAALLGMVITAPVWGGALQTLTSAGFVLAAYRLHVMKHGRRPETQAVDLDSLIRF